MSKKNQRMPVIFVGHGTPLNAIEDNQWSRGFAQLSSTVTRPQAILAISAHWYVDGVLLTGNAKPKTIHDFGGFPRPLYEIQYPAPGQRDLAAKISTLLKHTDASVSDNWGIDHGSWSVLRWMYPQATIPVIQLSIDRRLSPRAHYELARSLADLREQGVLILASGNLTHNLRDALTRDRHAPVANWAREFDNHIAHVLQTRDTARLTSIWPNDDIAKRAHPSADHWLPLLYAYGASDDRDSVTYPITGFDYGSLSMRTVIFS